MSEIRRVMMAAGRRGEDPYAGWVRLVINFTSAGTRSLVDGNTSRVTNAQLAAMRMIVDGTEITPVRSVELSAGEHVVYEYINDGMNAAWWYWVGGVTEIEIPQNITNIHINAFVLATKNNTIMKMHIPCPFTNAPTSYILSRSIVTESSYVQGYLNAGFTNVTTF